ncbi:natriuretic peptide A-like [Lampris incognitus]|uniref:natriuretic peptide A-like n=1 Tax=Lampris incognitus TaxID=2546036 RepID=UPI0024B4967D|nr:natriuretic peptide A-like [Lampris incognitus]
MISHICFCSLTALLLLNLVGGKPLSDVQSLKQLLELESDAPYYAVDGRGGGGEDEEEEEEEEEERRWESGPANFALAGKENALARLLKDVVRMSKRSWGRYKKGGLRSCFGVRLERIGSFSGLGC